MSMTDPVVEELYCYRHPTVKTSLRCNRCGNPICPKCAIRTPVGFRCPDCVRSQQDKFYTGGKLDYLLAVVVALPLSLIAAAIFTFIIANIGFFSWIISFFLAPAVGGLIAEAVRRVVQRRRSRYLSYVTAGCLVLAVLPFAILVLLGGNFLGLIVPGILLFLGVGAIMARLR
jgi:predicted membrane channel-forming protein YqfA (hemolysin III family)